MARHRKRPTYLSHEVGELWLFDQDTRSVERWTPASEFPETFRDGITWTPAEPLPNTSAPPLLVSDEALCGARE